ncbi:MAG TPA: SRPBCC family protein [Burkholderiales bacterium]|nr:SRPBCC family protein [Burkholderiales bacterium]
MAARVQGHGLATLRAGVTLLISVTVAPLCIAVSTPAAHAAQFENGVTIQAEKRGNAVAIEARAPLTAPLPLIWETLTDYDRLATFIPGMSLSRIIERRGSTTLVKQQGEAGFLFFTHPIDVVVEVLETPPYGIAVRVLSGNLKQLVGRYQIEPDAQRPGQFVLLWFGLIEPETRLPPLIGVPILRSNLVDQFRGLVREIERRAEQLRTKIKNNE